MKLSIGMMVKNEENNLERCLKSVQPLLAAIDSELIIVDTGSEDRTVDIAKRYTDKVYYHEWNDNFGEMRNLTISYAKGEWFFVIDADEELEDSQSIIDFLRMPESKKFNVGVLFVKNITDDREYAGFSTMISPRLFRKNKNFRYVGAVHHQALFEGLAYDLQTNLVHYGYVSNDADLMERKFQRTSTILKAELEKNPEDLYYLYQLSVTYGMHKDLEEAIEVIETAYDIFCKRNKPQKYIFVLIHRAMLYQMKRDFTKLEQACLESLQVADGYLDIYYYLAEACTGLEKIPAAIENYNIYLNMLDNYHKFTSKDAAVIDYTVANKELAFYNLSVLYKKVNDFAQALEYVEKLTTPSLIHDQIPNSVFLYVKLEKYKTLKHYYEQVIPKEDYSLFYMALEEVKYKFGFDEQVRMKIAKEFSNLTDAYGLLQRMIVEGAEGTLSAQTIHSVRQMDFYTLPAYCTDILYCLLKQVYPLEELFVNLNEVWLNQVADQLIKKHEEFGIVLLNYLSSKQFVGSSIGEYKLNKTLCRYLLMINQLDDKSYSDYFNRYLASGISYMDRVYQCEVLEKFMIYDVKNDEEVFFIYMYHAQINCQDKAEYVCYLRKALEVMPVLKRGFELRLNELQQPNQEMENYKQQVKGVIRELLNKGDKDQANALLTEYKSIVTDDIEALLLESQILLN